MWVKAAILILLAAATGLTGCMARQPGRLELPTRGTQHDVAMLDEAVALTLNGEHAVAAEKLLEVAPRFEAAGDRRRAAHAMFWLGFCRQRQGRNADARRAYTSVIKTYPEQPAAEKAREFRDSLPADDGARP